MLYPLVPQKPWQGTSPKVEKVRIAGRQQTQARPTPKLSLRVPMTKAELEEYSDVQICTSLLWCSPTHVLPHGVDPLVAGSCCLLVVTIHHRKYHWPSVTVNSIIHHHQRVSTAIHHQPEWADVTYSNWSSSHHYSAPKQILNPTCQRSGSFAVCEASSSWTSGRASPAAQPWSAPAIGSPQRLYTFLFGFLVLGGYKKCFGIRDRHGSIIRRDFRTINRFKSKKSMSSA